MSKNSDFCSPCSVCNNNNTSQVNFCNYCYQCDDCNACICKNPIRDIFLDEIKYDLFCHTFKRIFSEYEFENEYFILKSLYNIYTNHTGTYHSCSFFKTHWLDELKIVEEKDDCKFTINIADVEEISIRIYTEQELNDEVYDYVYENIQFFNPHMILHNLKPSVKKLIEVENDDESITSDDLDIPEPETKYDVDECPVCMEEYNEENKKFGHCGHCLCESCFLKVVKSDNSVCPCCRTDWDYSSSETSSEWIQEPFNEDDVMEYIESDNSDMLRTICDIRGVVIDAVYSDGYEHTLNYSLVERIDDECFMVVVEC